MVARANLKTISSESADILIERERGKKLACVAD